MSTLPKSCRAVKDADASAVSGTQTLNIGGTEVKAYCDMETDGGGWMLALNYLHKGANYRPPLLVRNDLPYLGVDTLGVDESFSGGSGGSWGHASAAVLSQARGEDAASLGTCCPDKSLRYRPPPIGLSAIAHAASPAFLRLSTLRPQLPSISEVRFYGKSGAHSRIVHFLGPLNLSLCKFTCYTSWDNDRLIKGGGAGRVSRRREDHVAQIVIE